MSGTVVIKETMRASVLRYIRSPALLFIALAAPIAAHFMVPDSSAKYAVLTINNAYPILTPSVLGLELGVITATILLPLAYIFLRAGPTKNRPWQVIIPTAHSGISVQLGRWFSEILFLFIILAVLALAGVILGVFRLGWAGSNPFKTIATLLLIAGPALILVAAIRTALAARSLTRLWPGDVLFLMFWMFFLVFAIMSVGFDSTDGQTRPIYDAFGFVAPVVLAAHEPVEFVSIGGSSAVVKSTSIDAWAGVTHGSYLLSRLVWILGSAALVILSGLVGDRYVKPLKTRGKGRQLAHSSVGFAPLSSVCLIAPGIIQKKDKPRALQTFSSAFRLIFKGRFYLGLLGAASVAGFFLPYRTIIGPALWLLVLFLVVTEAGRW